MPILKEKPTTQDFQQYLKELEVERGFTHETIIEKCLLLGEEVGELFKAIRKDQKMKHDSNSKFGTVSEELADILMYVFAIANRCNIDIEKAFRDKEEINKKRTWKQGV